MAVFKHKEAQIFAFAFDSIQCEQTFNEIESDHL